MKTIIYNNNDDSGLISAWDTFVNNHPYGNIFQTSMYYNLFAGKRSFNPIAILLYNEEGHIKAVITGIIQYQLPGPLKNLTSRCVVIGGPLAQNNDPFLLKTILDAFDKYIENRAIYTQFRNLFDINFGFHFLSDLGYIHMDHLNILVDLTQSEILLFKDVHKRKRYEITRAGREGLTIKPIITSVDLALSYELLVKVYKRINLPIFPFSVFQHAFEILMPKGMAVFWGAYLNGQLVGTMYTLCYKGRIYDYFAGSNGEFKNKFPNSLIPWQVMMWGKNHGMTLFDWGGAGKPGVPYGVRDYKEKFGGKVVNFGRFEKIHKPVLFRIAKIAFGIWQHVKA